MHKLTVRVSERVRDAIADEADRKGVSMAELIRTLVARHVPGVSRAVLVDGVELSGGLWALLQVFRKPSPGCPGGRKIEAIKAIRAETHLGLREAKSIADAIWKDLL